MASKEEIISIREFSRRLGVSDTAVRNEVYHPKTCKNGCLRAGVSINKKNNRPTIIYAIALAEWQKAGRTIKSADLIPTGDVSQAVPISIPHDELGIPAPLPEAKTPIIAGSGIDRTTQIYEAERLDAVYKAGIKELQYLKLLGSLVPVERVRAILFEYGKSIKETILQYPARIAPQVRAAESDAEAQKIMYKELEALLVMLSTGPAQSMSEDAPELDGDDSAV